MFCQNLPVCSASNLVTIPASDLSSFSLADFFRVDYFARRAEKYLRLLQHKSCVDIDVVPEADEVENGSSGGGNGSNGGAVQPSQRRSRRPVVTIPPPAEL